MMVQSAPQHKRIANLGGRVEVQVREGQRAAVDGEQPEATVVLPARGLQLR